LKQNKFFLKKNQLKRCPKWTLGDHIQSVIHDCKRFKPAIKRTVNIEKLKWMFALRTSWILSVRGPSKDARHTAQNKQQKEQ